MDTKRFNNPEYKNRIRAVRTYRRQVQAKPETAAGKFFYHLGLQSLGRKIFAFLALAILVYLAYFAKFLQINPADAVITGVDDQAKQQVLSRLSNYQRGFKYLMPQKNILFFSENSFSQYLLATDPQVAKINAVRKKLWHGLEIDLQQRVPEFVLQIGENSYILNSDGTIAGQLQLQAQPAPPLQAAGQAAAQPVPAPSQPALPYPLIIDSANDSAATGEKFFSDQQSAFIQNIEQNFSKTVPAAIQKYAIDGKASDDLTVYTVPGFKVIFNNTTDPQQYLQRLAVLWQQLTPAQQANLSYFDLRFEKNAYGCYRTDPCAQ